MSSIDVKLFFTIFLLINKIVSTSQDVNLQNLEKFRIDVLRQHNFFREKHAAPPLELDDELNQSAQNYAEYLARIDQLELSSDRTYGENLAVFHLNIVPKIDGIGTTNFWYDHIIHYDFSRAIVNEKSYTFTQVVWKESRRLGVGVAQTIGKPNLYIVARYDPLGNIPDQFESNVFPARY